MTIMITWTGKWLVHEELRGGLAMDYEVRCKRAMPPMSLRRY